jgi:hypothetical protein
MANTSPASITVTLLDDKTFDPDTLFALRMRIEEVLNGEHGRRLVRQLDGIMPAGIKWSLTQTPKPKDPNQPSHAEILAAQKQRDAETQEWFAARKAARAQSGEYNAALRRLEDRGLDGPSQQQVLAEMSRARTEADAAIHAANGTTSATTSTDLAVKRILKRKGGADTNTNSEE